MPRYRVRHGQQLPHHGKVLNAGEVIEMPADLAADPMIAFRVELVDIAVYDKSLTPTEVKKQYESAATPRVKVQSKE